MMEQSEFGKRALRLASDRLASSSDDDERAIAVAEAAYWVAALDEMAMSSIGTAGYYVLRSQHRFGSVVSGIVYARNLTTHQLVAPYGVAVVPAEVHVNFDGTGLKKAKVYAHFGDAGVQPAKVRFAKLCWKPLDQLPAPARPERHGRDQDYERWVSGREAASVLADALTYFDEILGPAS